MKKFTQIFENESIDSKVNELREKLNNIKDLDVNIEHKSSGKTVLMKVELTLNRNLKKLTPEALSTIMGNIEGYIEAIQYKENTNKVLLKIKSFEHLL